MSEYILEMVNVTKEFPGVKALDNVTLKIKPGQIHGLVGENGAGKSTLMKVLSGVFPHGNFDGKIIIDGREQKFNNVKDSEKAGIGIIYQELMLIPYLNIAENIFLGRVDPIIKWEKVHEQAKIWMQQVGLDESPEILVKDLGIGKQQLVEIAKALSLNATILILDEPTAALTEKEVNHLMNKLKEIRDNGITCIYISHKLEEVLNICDEVTILRDGATVGNDLIANLNEQKIISKMVGRDFTDRFPAKKNCARQDVVFEIRNVSLSKFDDNSKHILSDISFKVKQGEILGIAGLMGAGRTELVNSLFGDFKGKFSGEIRINNIPVKIKNPLDAIRNGLGLVTEDRKFNGLNLAASVESNIIMASLEKLTKYGIINENLAIQECGKISERLQIKMNSMETQVMDLSGGNQQKVVLAKWLMVNPKVLIIDEPTRGIDVGAKYEIYCLMNELKEQGIAIIMVSSELPEILGMSDRIVVLKEGRITGIFDNYEITEEMIMEKATGGFKQ